MKFCPNLHFMYGEHDFPDRFEAAARDGFDHVEFCFAYDTGLETVRQALREAGQKVVSFNFPTGKLIPAQSRGLACLPGSEAVFDDQIEEGLDWARALGVRQGLAPLAGIVPAGLDHEDAWAVYFENMTRAARRAEAAGFTLLVEPHNTVEHPGYILSLLGHARALADHVKSSRLRILFDTFHVQIMEGNLVSRYLEHAAFVDHVQVGSVPGRHEPTYGEINHGFLFSQIRKAGYDGWIAGEYFPRAGTSEGLGWMVDPADGA